MRSECDGDFLTCWSVEEWFERAVLNGFVAGVGTVVFEAVDGVNGKDVKGSEVEGEGGGFKLPEAVPARKMPTERDGKGECGLLK